MYGLVYTFFNSTDCNCCLEAYIHKHGVNKRKAYKGIVSFMLHIKTYKNLLTCGPVNPNLVKIFRGIRSCSFFKVLILLLLSSVYKCQFVIKHVISLQVINLLIAFYRCSISFTISNAILVILLVLHKHILNVYTSSEM